MEKLMKCAFRHPRLGLLAIGLAGLLSAAGSALAAGDSVAGRVAPLAAQADASLGVSPEQRLREELRVLLLDMIESGAFGQTPAEQISLSIDAPAQRTSGLGVLVDSSSGARAERGLQVLGTTPGSKAGRMGLRSGDLIVAVNSMPLSGLGDDASGGARAAQVLRDEVEKLEDGAALTFSVVRDGLPIEVSGAMASAWVPALHLTVGEGVSVAAGYGRDDRDAIAASGCGRINIFDVAPRQRELHAATLISIDGKRSPFKGQTSFRVSAGEHVLKVAERIESRYLDFNDRFRNDGPDSRYKTLTVQVAPNTTYQLGVQLNKDKRNEWRDGAYWDPVIWNESAEDCR
jgi:hypothetical protein